MHSNAKRPQQNRELIKYGVRLALSGRVFVCFLVCLIPSLLPLVMNLIPLPEATSFHVLAAVIGDQGFTLQFSWLSILLSAAATVFVTDPMAVKVSAFFLQLSRDKENLPSPLVVADCFGPGYLRLAGGMALRGAIIWLCTLIPLGIALLVPGAYQIVEITGGREAIYPAEWLTYVALLSIALNTYCGLRYSMVPYLLADRPGIGPVEALRESVRMTRGRLWELFVLQLSFFGWLLLTTFTMMLAAIYVYPYIEGTMAAYYLAFKEPMPWEKEMLI